MAFVCQTYKFDACPLLLKADIIVNHQIITPTKILSLPQFLGNVGFLESIVQNRTKHL